MCIGLDSDRAGSRTLEKSSQRDRYRVCAKFESSCRFRGSNMKPKKKSRRCRGLGLDSGLDLAISRFIYSLGVYILFYIFGGIFFFFFFILYSALLHLPPLRFHCPDGCWDRTQDRATGALAVVMSNQRFFKIVCFRFPTNVPKKIEHIRF